MITPEDNIVLTGFSGTGKTTVGRLLAARLRRRFVDMDEEISRRLELTIPGIFARFGEARFRDEERQLAKELAAHRGLVVAAGGGTIVDKLNFELFASSGVVIALRARPETIARRLEGLQPRPLLEDPDPLARIRELKAARRHVYDAVPLQIQTDDLLPAEVVDLILEQAQVNTEE